MIAHLEGVVAEARGGKITLDVGGVGYRVRVGAETYAALADDEGEQVKLFTHLAVRENAHDLYGFLKKDDLDFFELLIGIPGIGPKTALGILNVADPSTLRNAVISGESGSLTKVSGIGKKNAEKIILELRGKLGGTLDEAASSAQAEDADALAALETLGYGREDAREALRKVPKEISGAQKRLTEALKLLAR